MAFPLPPQTFRCSDCQWAMTIPHPIGNVRLRGLNHVDSCPRCGSRQINQSNANALDITLARLRQTINRHR